MREVRHIYTLTGAEHHRYVEYFGEKPEKWVKIHWHTNSNDPCVPAKCVELNRPTMKDDLMTTFAEAHDRVMPRTSATSPETVLDVPLLERVQDFLEGLSDLVEKTDMSIELSSGRLLVLGEPTHLFIEEVLDEENDSVSFALEVRDVST